MSASAGPRGALEQDGSRVQIATLREGEQVHAVFACVRKERQVSRNGAPYLTLELRDGTGSILARAFRDADLLSSRFERGDIVLVDGRVQRFRGELQISLQRAERTQVSDRALADFLPASRLDLDELEGFLEHLVREVYDERLRLLCERVLASERVRRNLRLAPCGLPAEPGRRTARHHHAYLGGLLEHTVAVASMAVELCTVHPRLDRDLLICAAVLHDIGRTAEFTYGAEIGQTEEGRLLGHVELGLRMIEAGAPEGLAPGRLLALEHCVAAHHGAEGAQIRFASAEALALHRLNALDAGVKGALERGLAIK